MELRKAKRMELAKPSFIRESLKLTADPSIISFAGGNPDPNYFPWKEIESSAKIAISNDWRRALQYSITEGNIDLRCELQELMSNIGVETCTDQLVITSGSQQGLDIVAKIFLDKGDQVIIESPTYMGALNAFKYYEPDFLEVETDNNGMRMDALEEVLMANTSTKLIYTIPDFQNPTGNVLSEERRQKMIELAQKYDIMIVEDNPYYFLRHEGQFIPPIKHFDKYGRVIFLGSVSKILCPSLRVGWIVANKDVISSVVYLKQAADLHTSELSQRITANYMKNYNLSAHISEMNRLYKEKKDLMLHKIKECFPSSIKYTTPEGGFFIWLTFPKRYDTMEIFNKVKQEQRVIFVPGDTFYPYGGHANTARFSFATVTLEEIDRGMGCLASALNKIIE